MPQLCISANPGIICHGTELVVLKVREAKEPQLASTEQTPSKPTEFEMPFLVIRRIFVILHRAGLFARLCQLGKNTAWEFAFI